jgi:hypothetical protein
MPENALRLPVHAHGVRMRRDRGRHGLCRAELAVARECFGKRQGVVVARGIGLVQRRQNLTKQGFARRG